MGARAAKESRHVLRVQVSKKHWLRSLALGEAEFDVEKGRYLVKFDNEFAGGGFHVEGRRGQFLYLDEHEIHKLD